MEQPALVSVIVPCYNMEKYLADTIASVRSQTWSDWELLMVDDASTDGTARILHDFSQQDPRIKVAVKTEHTGIADTRNRCLQQAKGRYFAFLDADDLWHPEKLAKQLRFMQERNAAFSYTSYDLIDENGQPLGKTIKATGDLNYQAYLRNTLIGCSTVMFDTEKVGEVVVPSFRTSEDTATWLNLLRRGVIAQALPEALTSYRIRVHSASSNKWKAATDLWRVYRRQEKLSLPNALYSFSCYAFNAVKKRLRS